ncbi:TPA: hypothetical protein RG825_002939, partial [Pseudomonas aeruginosa]
MEWKYKHAGMRRVQSFVLPRRAFAALLDCVRGAFTRTGGCRRMPVHALSEDLPMFHTLLVAIDG